MTLEGTATDEIGSLTVVNGGSPASLLPVVAHDSGWGPFAFAVYHSPTNFVRAAVASDSQAVQRKVQLQISCTDPNGTTTNSTTALAVVRPPVVLIHGLWANASDSWANFVPKSALQNALWSSLPENSILAVNYDESPDDVVSSVLPAYDPLVFDLTKVKRNALGFDYNAPFVLKRTRQYIRAFGETFNVAVIQADVVAHSMGGNIARTMALLPDFSNPESYGKGNIHKLITIGTPHTGTRLAIDLLMSANSCTREALAYKGQVSLQFVNFYNSPSRACFINIVSG
jgi:pimeloyl-ACP methyl ester carboxylesterase